MSKICIRCGNEFKIKRKNFDLCEECRKIIICPKCGKERKMSSYSNALLNKNNICLECSNDEKKIKYLGENNPFYGKKHSKKTKDKISSANSKWERTEEQKQKLRDNLKIFGNTKSPYSIWTEKYGKEEADKRLMILKEKQSKNSSGPNNSMYGKPSPEGSGNGWSGWYKGWYFRSLRELSYMINEIEAKNLTWKSAESKELIIDYNDWNGNKRTYRADFLIEEKYLVECKPEKLMNSINVKLKQEAAIKFCKDKGYEYQLIEPKILSNEKIKELYLSKKIKFLDRYKEKYEKLYA